MGPTKEDFCNMMERLEKQIEALADSPISRARFEGQLDLCEQILNAWED